VDLDENKLRNSLGDTAKSFTDITSNSLTQNHTTKLLNPVSEGTAFLALTATASLSLSPYFADPVKVTIRPSEASSNIKHVYLFHLCVGRSTLSYSIGSSPGGSPVGIGGVETREVGRMSEVGRSRERRGVAPLRIARG